MDHVAGVIAKLLHHGSRALRFHSETLLGIAGAFVATFLGQAIGSYRPDQGAGLIASIVGAIIILAYGRVRARWRRAA